ncbi:MAG: hypothetical protein KDK30_12460 [Leptospiraceae bacterium]|nr:hypothetical protein [Leptospiraceae bacterium]
MDSALHYELRALSEIDQALRERMFLLMRENFDAVHRDTFEVDLQSKHLVGLLFDAHRTLQGFTTYALNPTDCGTDEYDILYSGDTIIAPACWGSQELVRGFGHTIGQLLAGGRRKLYWYLLSMGHRTYMYLVLFFRNFFPAAHSPIGFKNTSSASSTSSTSFVNDQDAEQRQLEAIARRTSGIIFPEEYNPATGIVRFAQPRGQLKSNLARASFQRRNNQHVRFFLERNPGFVHGDELVCLALIHPDNIRSFGRTAVLEGMQTPLSREND